MQTKNIVSNNLKEFVLQLQVAVKERYSVVEESVDFHAGYWKVLVQKEEGVYLELGVCTYQDAKEAVEMLDNPEEPNDKLKEVLESVPEAKDSEIKPFSTKQVRRKK